MSDNNSETVTPVALVEQTAQLDRIIGEQSLPNEFETDFKQRYMRMSRTLGMIDNYKWAIVAVFYRKSVLHVVICREEREVHLLNQLYNRGAIEYLRIMQVQSISSTQAGVYLDE